MSSESVQRGPEQWPRRWKDVDFGHGTLASFRTKTGRAQYFVGDGGLMALLRARYAFRGAPKAEEPIVAAIDYAPRRG